MRFLRCNDPMSLCNRFDWYRIRAGTAYRSCFACTADAGTAVLCILCKDGKYFAVSASMSCMLVLSAVPVRFLPNYDLLRMIHMDKILQDLLAGTACSSCNAFTNKKSVTDYLLGKETRRVCMLILLAVPAYTLSILIYFIFLYVL